MHFENNTDDHSDKALDSSIEEAVAQEQASLASLEVENAQDELVGEPLKAKGQLFTEFVAVIENEASPEEKIRLSIEFMKTALSLEGTPRFKDFWEGRRLCLPLFKANLAPKARAELWSAYVELSTEAKRLKDLLDEQSAFAVEQIELAIAGLEGDLEYKDQIIAQVKGEIISDECLSLQHNKDLYNNLERELRVYNDLAARINGLRKEVIKTEMRVRMKNKLIDRLSLCGDKIFPRRKELIKQISTEFLTDVERFVVEHFETDEFRGLPLYALRDEIKRLQSIAKALTLNTRAFTDTRLKLSSCWDKLKERDKERRKEVNEKRESYRKNYDLVLEKIQPFKSACEGEISMDECQKQATEIFNFMQSLELSYEDVRSLKQEVYAAKRPILDKAQSVELERTRKDREAETERKEKIESLKTALSELVLKAPELDLDSLTLEHQELLKRYEQTSLSKIEKVAFERTMRQVKDLIEDKREKRLLNLSDEDQKTLDMLQEMLDDRKERRVEIKTQLEHYRKSLGGSGFDFEKAMSYRDRIEEEKLRLEKINQSISEIEEKISLIEG